MAKRRKMTRQQLQAQWWLPTDEFLRALREVGIFIRDDRQLRYLVEHGYIEGHERAGLDALRRNVAWWSPTAFNQIRERYQRYFKESIPATDLPRQTLPGLAENYLESLTIAEDAEVFLGVVKENERIARHIRAGGLKKLQAEIANKEGVADFSSLPDSKKTFWAEAVINTLAGRVTKQDRIAYVLAHRMEDVRKAAKEQWEYPSVHLAWTVLQSLAPILDDWTNGREELAFWKFSQIVRVGRDFAKLLERDFRHVPEMPAEDAAQVPAEKKIID